MGGPFFKSEMGGLPSAWPQACVRGRRSNSDTCQRVDRSEIRRFLSARFMGSYAGILHLSHFIFKKRASHALRTHLCKILMDIAVEFHHN
jgi:hypothetical protein